MGILEKGEISLVGVQSWLGWRKVEKLGWDTFWGY